MKIPLTASPEKNRNARDTGSSVDASLRAPAPPLAQPAKAAVATEAVNDAPYSLKSAPLSSAEQKPSFLGLTSFATTTFADISTILAVVPFVLFTGPNQTDTAYSIATPVAILGIAPVLGAALASKLPAMVLATSSCGARLAIASSLQGSLGGMDISASTIVLSLAFIWGFRLQEVSTVSFESSKIAKLLLCALPMFALMVVLKFFEPLQPMLMQSALTLYAVALVALALDHIIKRITTTGNTIQNSVAHKPSTAVVTNSSSSKAFRTVAYEILVSTCASLIPVASVLLVITDQGLATPLLRNDVIASLGGYSIGAIATAFISRKYWFKITHLHIAFTLFLAIMLISRTSLLALSALLFTSMIAGAITMTVNNSRWQKPFTLMSLVLVSYLSYLYLTPLQSTWMPIHALRMLVGNLFAVSAMALLVTARGRLTILAFLRRLRPRKTDGGTFDTTPARSL